MFDLDYGCIESEESFWCREVGRSRSTGQASSHVCDPDDVAQAEIVPAYCKLAQRRILGHAPYLMIVGRQRLSHSGREKARRGHHDELAPLIRQHLGVGLLYHTHAGPAVLREHRERHSPLDGT